jgi:hypothetical protein
MAEQSPLLLATDPSKVNPAGAEPSDLENYQKSLNDQIQALETRYQQPNWWKVAAGFAKPQLGGFMASLGSASEALGENVEQQRQMALPIAQMRSQLAQSQILTGQNQKAADLYAEHLKSGKPVDENLVGEMMRLAPEAASTKAAVAQLAAQQKKQEINVSGAEAIAKIIAYAQDRAIDPEPLLEQAGFSKKDISSATKDITSNKTEISSPTIDKTEKIITLPNGARVNDVQSYLSSLGVPIISGVRTKEEQNALKDHKDANGHWVTAQGLPVADVSKHTSGQAVDVDTKSLTDEQRGMLKASGFKQTDPKNDPNHWELTSSATSTAKEPPVDTRQEFSSMPTTSPLNPTTAQAKLNAEQLSQDNDKYRAEHMALREAIGPTSGLGSRAITAVNSLMQQLSYDKEDQKKEEQLLRILGVLTQGGALNAAMAAASKGLGIKTPFGGAEIAIPFDELIAKNFSGDDQAVARKIGMNLGTLVLWQQKHTGQSLGNMPIAELTLMNSASPNVGMPLDAIRYGVSKAHNQISYLHDLLNNTTQLMSGTHPKYKLSERDRPIQYYSAYNHPMVNDAYNNYIKEDENIEKLSQAAEKNKRKNAQKP